MKIKINILIVLFLFAAFNASAFTPLSPDTFKSPVRKFFEKVWECKWHIDCYNKLGAFTQLNSTDRQVNFPTTYNNNLNITMETGTTTVGSITSLPNLATVGTLTSGTWNAGIIPILYGGSGTSTGIQPRGVVFGNGAYGLTVASTTGTTGQFLTSQGASAFPIWQSASVNETSDYNFTGTYFGVKNLNASSTVSNPLKLNDVSYSFPSALTASSSVLGTNATGVLTWVSEGNKLLSAPADTYQSVATAVGASTTVFRVPIIANEFASGEVIRVTFNATNTWSTSSGNAVTNFNLSLGGFATSSCGYFVDPSAIHGATSTWSFNIRAISSSVQSNRCSGQFNAFAISGAAAAQSEIRYKNLPGNAGEGRDLSSAQGTVNLANEQILMFEVFQAVSAAANPGLLNVFNVTAELLNY